MRCNTLALNLNTPFVVDAPADLATIAPVGMLELSDDQLAEIDGGVAPLVVAGVVGGCLLVGAAVGYLINR